MHPYEIYFAPFPWGGCNDPRPWLIIEARPNDLFACFPISGQCYGNGCFEINRDDPCFAATGLTKSCYVHYISIVQLHRSRFTRRKGQLTGDLLQRFLKSAGLD